ncbi:MAG: hypothetical protein JWM68_1966 [Verrucomicrobiales bacterium]|nr:hypothetical protein [Verrucomicrobiales bacterium]
MAIFDHLREGPLLQHLDLCSSGLINLGVETFFLVCLMFLSVSENLLATILRLPRYWRAQLLHA